MTVGVPPDEPTPASVRGLLQSFLDEVPPGEPLEDVPGEAHASSALPDAATEPLTVAYLLPGLPPEGSGGSHSLVQEARGLRELGARARICVPSDSLETAAAVYGNEDELFQSYTSGSPGAGSDESVAAAIGAADVVVATEYPSVDLLARLQRARPELLCAYYVQDYEPLFAAPESSRADRALLSYRALPDALLFAKTDWLGELVSSLHGVPVAKVAPSLDRELFHADGRVAFAGVLRVAAMIRPRTPRRRAAATLAALGILARTLGEAVEVVTFGCDREAFEEVQGEAPASAISHLGLLGRHQVAELMRRCDVFIDGSAYQAFGRTGLEAMACGAVPVLPALGGVHEYAIHDLNAVILEEGSPAELAGAVLELAEDPGRLEALRDAGVRTGRGFSVERAARSQLELFTAALAARRAAPQTRRAHTHAAGGFQPGFATSNTEAAP